MAVAGAPKELQPWLTQTDSRLQVAESNLLAVQQGLAQIPQQDKSVFINPATQGFTTPGSAAQVVYPTSNTVKYSNTTGLMEVVLSCSLQTFAGGRVGVGFYYDLLQPVISNGMPQYGMADSGVSTTAYTLFGSSYNFVFPVRPGLYTCGIYYYSDNTSDPVRSQGSVNYAQLIVRSV
jgi:hypothetical protein